MPGKALSLPVEKTESAVLLYHHCWLLKEINSDVLASHYLLALRWVTSNWFCTLVLYQIWSFFREGI